MMPAPRSLAVSPPAHDGHGQLVHYKCHFADSAHSQSLPLWPKPDGSAITPAPFSLAASPPTSPNQTNLKVSKYSSPVKKVFQGTHLRVRTLRGRPAHTHHTARYPTVSKVTSSSSPNQRHARYRTRTHHDACPLGLSGLPALVTIPAGVGHDAGAALLHP